MNMAQKMIRGAGNFGLAINSACRVYKIEQRVEILDVIQHTLDLLLPYIDLRTLQCISKDWQPVKPPCFESDKLNIPVEQKDRFHALREKAMVEFMNRSLDDKIYTLEQIGDLMDCVEEDKQKGIFKSRSDFYIWAKEHRGQSTPCIVDDNGEIPISDEYLRDFNTLCLLMARYSVGRQSYMPSTTAEFILANIDNICNETAQKILEATASAEDSCWCKMRYALKDKFIAQSSEQR